MRRYIHLKKDSIDGMVYEDIPIDIDHLMPMTRMDDLVDTLVESRKRIVRVTKRRLAARRFQHQSDALWELYRAQRGLRASLDTSVRHLGNYPVRRVAR